MNHNSLDSEDDEEYFDEQERANFVKVINANMPAWDYNQQQQQHAMYNSTYNGAPPQQVSYEQSWVSANSKTFLFINYKNIFAFQNQQQQIAPTWDYNQQHAIYNNTYNNYKTEYNCLNQPPAPAPPQQPSIAAPQTHIHHQSTDPSTIYNGANYNYYYQTPDPHQVHHLQADYTNINHHSNYQNNPM